MIGGTSDGVVDELPADSAQTHSRGLDAVRGVAAVLVVLAHARDAVFRAHDLDPSGSGVVRLLLGPASLSQEALALFFVLSGYLVGGQVIRLVERDRFRWPGYLARRLPRLWLVLIPALVVTALADWLSGRLAPGTLRVLSPGVHDLGTGACNAAFLMGSRCEPYGSNFPLWSLSYELWFYVVFAGAATAVGGLRHGRLGRAGIGLLVATGGVVVFGPDLLRLFPAWLIGAAVAWAHHRARAVARARGERGRSRLTWGVAIGLLVFSALASNLLQPDEAVRFVVVGAAAVPLIWLCASSEGRPAGRVVDLGARLGGWSYSIYAFHRPVVVLLVVLSVGWWGADPLWSLLATYGVAALAISVAYPLSRMTEAHTGSVRSWALRQVAGTSAR